MYQHIVQRRATLQLDQGTGKISVDAEGFSNSIVESCRFLAGYSDACCSAPMSTNTRMESEIASNFSISALFGSGYAVLGACAVSGPSRARKLLRASRVAVRLPRYHLISVACGRKGKLPGVSVRIKMDSLESGCAAGRLVEDDHGRARPDE
jgi:hypothetical protein